MLSYVFRLVLCEFYAKAEEERRSDSRWQKLFTISTILSGVIWGAAIYAIFPADSQNHQALLILVLVLLSSATTVSHSAYRFASVSFSTCCLLPASIFLFTHDQQGYPELGVFLVLFWVVMASSGGFLQRNAERMFSLSHENRGLVRDLKDINLSLQEQNRELEETKQDLDEANKELQRLATTDALTGLTNRRVFDAMCKLKWERSAYGQTPLSLLLLNFDNFKSFNEVYGHRVADSALSRVASYLTSLPEINRQDDCIARYKGDEFAILLFESSESHARSLGEDLRRGIELLHISSSKIPSDSGPWLSVSVGVATTNNFTDVTVEDLLDKADMSLVEAKRLGRNRSVHNSDISAA
jgi:diguanylate cyclase (GGDEF)-like protein